MTSDTVSESARANVNLLASPPPTTLAQTGEVEIAGHRYVTAERLARVLGVTVRTLARRNAASIGSPKIAIGKTVLFAGEFG